MPCLKIVTNVPSARIPSDFVNKIIPLLSKVVKKPEPKFICAITGDAQISFGGNSTDLVAVATLESIGNLGAQENIVISKELSVFVEKELGVAPSRFFISFYDIKAHNVGIAGSTAEVLGV